VEAEERQQHKADVLIIAHLLLQGKKSTKEALDYIDHSNLRSDEKVRAKFLLNSMPEERLDYLKTRIEKLGKK
jgi:hypothetical protein